MAAACPSIRLSWVEAALLHDWARTREVRQLPSAWVEGQLLTGPELQEPAWVEAVARAQGGSNL